MSVPLVSPVVMAPVPDVVKLTSPLAPAFSENVLKAMWLFAPVVRLMFVDDARVMSAENVIAPVFELPRFSVPAVTRSSSASVSEKPAAVPPRPNTT